MKYLVIFGPNLNLTGFISQGDKMRLTLGKMHTALRKTGSVYSVDLKIYQLQSEAAAANLIARQRNRVDAIVLIPGIWAKTGHLLLETLEMIGLPVAVGDFALSAGKWDYSGESILTQVAIMEQRCETVQDLQQLLIRFHDHLSQIR
jgi:3-dehydroquinate dehydratase-2